MALQKGTWRLAAVAASILAVSTAAKADKFEPTWPSLAGKELPEWVIDAKFGVYTHWGVYSIPAHGGPDYLPNLYSIDKDLKGVYSYHTEKYGKLEDFGYTDFIKQFTAPKFNAKEWVGLMHEAGAKFGGIALVHHDGFLLWDSKVSRWNSKNMGPKRDVYGEIAQAVREYPDMKLAATFHHGRTYDWAFGALPDAKKLPKEAKDWEIFNPELGDFFWHEGRDPVTQFADDWKSKITEVVDTYKPDFIWFDGLSNSMKGNHPPKQYVQDVIAHFYNESDKRGQDVIVANKFSAQFNFPADVGLLSYENGRDMPEYQPGYWLSDRAIGYPWSYINDKTYRDGPDYQVDSIIDVVSRGGIMFLSLTPMGDGSIPAKEVEIMQGIGKWMKLNGEAIYGTRRFSVFGEGPTKVTRQVKVKNRTKMKWNLRNLTENDIRFTQKDNTLYASFMAWPKDNVGHINTLNSDFRFSTGGEIDSVELLSSGEQLKWSRDKDGLHVIFPDKKHGLYAYVLKIKVKGDLVVTEPDAAQIELLAQNQ